MAYKSITINITNTYVEGQEGLREEELTMLSTMVTNGTMATDTKHQLLVSNYFESVFDNTRLVPYSGSICMNDYHCFDNGVCQYGGSGGRPICVCNTGFAGANC